jgi:hypothetical protein
MSMRRVAEELGTGGPASLYRHVTNKDALIDLMVDRVAAEIALPEPDPEHWQEQLREWVLEVWRVFHRHPGVAALTLGRVPVGPNLVRFTEWTLGLLRGAGIPDRIAAYSGDLLGLYVDATGYEATLPVPSPTGEPRPPGRWWRSRPGFLRPLLTGQGGPWPPRSSQRERQRSVIRPHQASMPPLPPPWRRWPGGEAGPGGGAGPLTGRSTVARRRMVRTNRNTQASMITNPATPMATFSRKVEETTTTRPSTNPTTASLSRRPRWARNDAPT